MKKKKKKANKQKKISLWYAASQKKIPDADMVGQQQLLYRVKGNSDDAYVSQNFTNGNLMETESSSTCVGLCKYPQEFNA